MPLPTCHNTQTNLLHFKKMNLLLYLRILIGHWFYHFSEHCCSNVSQKQVKEEHVNKSTATFEEQTFATLKNKSLACPFCLNWFKKNGTKNVSKIWGLTEVHEITSHQISLSMNMQNLAKLSPPTNENWIKWKHWF